MKKNTILIVDDEEYIRNILKRIFECDYRIITAAEGLEALEKVKKEHPDLIILDNEMPAMNGLEVAWKLKRSDIVKHRHIPIIMLTVKSRVGEVEEGFSSGVDFYLPKPFTLAHLYDKVREALKIKDQKHGSIIDG
ncbi:MAG: response regulator [Elusimicrobiota bacterium]